MNVTQRKLSASGISKLITKAGFADLQRINEAALLGILLEAKKKLEDADKIKKKKLIQNYTNIGVRAFSNSLVN